MDSKTDKFIYWIPRIMSILFILFLAMFSLDVFESRASAREIAVGLFMHNIPVLVLLAALIAGWKREIVGAAAFILAGSLYVAMIATNAIQGQFAWYMLSWIITIAGPAFIIGGLFLAGWHRKKTQHKTAQ